MRSRAAHALAALPFLLASTLAACAAESSDGAPMQATAPGGQNGADASKNTPPADGAAPGIGSDMLPVSDPTASGAAGMGAAPDAPRDSAQRGDDSTPADPALPDDMADMAGAGAPEARADLGMGDGSDVIAIGDSWMNLGSVGIQQSLIAASGQPYRAYGVPGTRLLDEVIPNQYAQARTEDPDIKTVVVTGGGNDILQNPLLLLDCPGLGQACMDLMDMIGERYEALSEELAADGVEDVIIINYSRATALGPAPIEYAWEKLAPFCEVAPLNCHLVDPDEVAGGTMPLRDGIHPTDEGYDMLGEHIHELMVAEGMRR